MSIPSKKYLTIRFYDYSLRYQYLIFLIKEFNTQKKFTIFLIKKPENLLKNIVLANIEKIMKLDLCFHMSFCIAKKLLKDEL